MVAVGSSGAPVWVRVAAWVRRRPGESCAPSRPGRRWRPDRRHASDAVAHQPGV